MLPVPYLLQELLTAQIIPGQAILTELLLYFDLGGDTGMINARYPQSIVTLHSLETDQGILQCCVHCVTHMQLTGNIGRGHNDGERFGASVLIRLKVAAFLPHLVDFGFYLLRFINLGQFFSHNNSP